MSLDRVSLSPNALRLLYPRSLVALRREATDTSRAEATGTSRTEESSVAPLENSNRVAEVIEPPRYLGKNGQRVLILVHDPSSAFVDETGFAFLVTILNAVHLTMDDVALVNVAALSPAQKAAIPGQLQSRIVLAFGVEGATVAQSGKPGAQPLYQVLQNGGRAYLYSAPLAEVGADRTVKGRLWGCLKQLFQL